MMFKFESSAIDNISDVVDNQITITFKGGRDYVYTVSNVEKFVTELTNTINTNASVGRYVNDSIKTDQLVSV